MTLTVREMTLADVPLIADYWLQASPEHLTAMGVDLSKLPTREELEGMLTTQFHTTVQEKRSYCLIWEEQGKAVGHCNTNPTRFGQDAFMHLHLWEAASRKKGSGSALLSLSLPLFFERLALQQLHCEPYALNEAPNRTLQRLGFTLLKEYTTIPGSLSFEQPVKRWGLSREAFRRLKEST